MGRSGSSFASCDFCQSQRTIDAATMMRMIQGLSSIGLVV
jgi:hypothetical protein